MKSIDIVVPCYNEEEGLYHFVEETNKVIATLPQYKFRYILVNDGSKDKTYLVMKSLAKDFDNVKYISFSRNFGKESAMYAGLKNTDSDYVIVMDADLQHPPKTFPEMIKAVEEEGYDCCALRRTAREGEGKLRGLFSKLFFKLSNAISDVKMPYGAVDYRIMSRLVVDSILELCEVQRFSKGIFSWVGFNTKWIPYESVDRELGKTTWSFWGLFKYAIDGITSFSVAPLRFISGLGFVISIIAFIYIIITLVQTLIFGIDVPGYTTTLCAVLFLGGITEFSVGILGEYIGRVYIETKNRPIYLIKHTNIDNPKTDER
ncbi:MAG: glycosyltransferase family 2 protein [Acutalibacteraceae bacterium]